MIAWMMSEGGKGLCAFCILFCEFCVRIECRSGFVCFRFHTHRHRLNLSCTCIQVDIRLSPYDIAIMQSSGVIEMLVLHPANTMSGEGDPRRCSYQLLRTLASDHVKLQICETDPTLHSELYLNS